MKTSLPYDVMSSLPSLGPRQWKHIYRLFSLVLLADGRVIPEEMSVYIQKTIELSKSIDPSLVVTEKMLLDWFVLNKARIMADINSLLYDSIIIETQASLKGFKEKRAVIRSMIEIGIAGGDYSARKQMFVRKTMLYWSISRAEEIIILEEISNKPGEIVL